MGNGPISFLFQPGLLFFPVIEILDQESFFLLFSLVPLFCASLSRMDKELNASIGLLHGQHQDLAVLRSTFFRECDRMWKN